MSCSGRGKMIEDEQDEATFEKILEAAVDIKDMARIRPEEAPEMLEKARHLIELAGQIKSDLLRRKEADVPSTVTFRVVDGDKRRRVTANTEARSSTKMERGFWLEVPA